MTIQTHTVLHSGGPMIDYNRKLIEKFKRRDNRVGDLSLSWKRQVKSVGIFWFLSTEGRAQNKGKLGYAYW